MSKAAYIVFHAFCPHNNTVRKVIESAIRSASFMTVDISHNGRNVTNIKKTLALQTIVWIEVEGEAMTFQGG